MQKVPDPKVYECLQGMDLEFVVASTDRPALASRSTCKPQKPARSGFGTELSYLPTRVELECATAWRGGGHCG